MRNIVFFTICVFLFSTECHAQYAQSTTKSIDKIVNNSEDNITIEPNSSVLISTFTGGLALQSGPSKEVQESSVTSSELGYLSGVTGPIQSQIDNMTGVLPPSVGAFFDNVTRVGNEFNMNENITVDASNVSDVNLVVQGLPVSFTVQRTTQTTSSNVSVGHLGSSSSFAGLKGGTLTLVFTGTLTFQSGFAPQFNQITLSSGSMIFTFPIYGLSFDGREHTVKVDVPHGVDYTDFNATPSVTVRYSFQGEAFHSRITIVSVMNHSTGNLHQPIEDLITLESEAIKRELGDRIDNLTGEVGEGNSSLAAISDRISPYRTVQTSEVENRVLYNNADNTSITSQVKVSADNPQFTPTVARFILAVPSDHTYQIRNTVTRAVIPLSSATHSISIVRSSLFEGLTYFMYVIDGLLDLNTPYQVEILTDHKAVAWQYDIDELNDEVDAIEAKLAHPILNLPDEVATILENDTSVTEKDNPTLVANEYNKSKSTNGAQAFTFSGTSAVTSVTNTSTNRVVYLPASDTSDVSSNTLLRRVVDNVVYAVVQVPAIPAGTRTETLYLGRPNFISGAGVWQIIPTTTILDTTVTFDRDVPSTSKILTINYRGNSNGNIFGASSTTLGGVGGTQDVSTSFTLMSGSETATIIVKYVASSRHVIVEVSERSSTAIPVIRDVEFILSYTEERTVAATPATTRDVRVGSLATNTHSVLMFGASSENGNLVMTGNEASVDLGIPYLVNGISVLRFLFSTNSNARWLSFDRLTPNAALVQDLENHSNLPNFGLFTTNYTHETILNIGTQVSVLNSKGEVVTLGEESGGDVEKYEAHVLASDVTDIVTNGIQAFQNMDFTKLVVGKTYRATLNVSVTSTSTSDRSLFCRISHFIDGAHVFVGGATATMIGAASEGGCSVSVPFTARATSLFFRARASGGGVGIKAGSSLVIEEFTKELTDEF